MVTFEFRQGGKVLATAVTAAGAARLVATCGRLGRAWKHSRQVLRVVAGVTEDKSGAAGREFAVARTDERGISEFVDPALIAWEAAAKVRAARGPRKIQGLR